MIMAKKISLTSENTKYLIDAFTHFFPEDTIYAADKPYISGEFNWKNRADFIDFINRLTGILIKSERDLENIKKAQLAVEGLTSNKEEEKPVDSNLPDKEARELLELERQKREAELKEAKEKGEKSVQEAIKKKQEAYEQQKTKEAQIKREVGVESLEQKFPETLPKIELEGVLSELKDKIIYVVPISKSPQINLTENETKLVEIAKSDAQLFSEKLSELIVKKNPDIPPEILQPLSKIISVDTTQSLINPENNPVPPGVFAALINVPNKVDGLSAVTKNELAKSASIFVTFSESQDDLYRTVLNRTLGDNLTNSVLGFPEQQYTLSENPSDGAFTIKLDQLQNNSFTLQDDPIDKSLDSPLIETTKSLAEDKLKDFALIKIKSIGPESAFGSVAKITNSQAFDSIAPFIGVSTNFNYVGTGFFGKTVTKFFPRYAPLVYKVAEKMGVNIGIKAVAPVITQAAAKTGSAVVASTAVGKAVTAVASKVGLKATITAIGQALGSSVPVVGNIIAFIATEVVGKIIKKIPWGKVKKYASFVVGVVLGIGAYAIAGPIAGITVGFGSYGLTSIATGGTAGLKGAGTSIGNFFTALGGIVFTSIGMPILVTLLVFPVIVALILFIINSGAYIVPPTSEVFGGVSSPYIEIIKTPEPAGPFTNNELPKTITYKVTIIAKKGVLTNVGIKYDCQVTSVSSKNCPSTSDVPASVDSISPSLPYTFSYTSTYDTGYKDSAIVDTITVTADVAEKSGVTSETSASVTFGTPPITCPLPAGKPVNSMNYSYNSQADTGHGSTTYWNAMGGTPYRYSIPQWTGCRTPESCPYYGYAYDVFPNGVKTIYAPTVLGKSTTWNLSATFSNGAAGYTVMYTDTTGTHTIVLTHVASTNAPKTATSGTKVATLFNQGTNTHLHLEFQTNGRWVKPENYFCK
jgi:hypothetical protein